jgi:hypothetical protein
MRKRLGGIVPVTEQSTRKEIQAEIDAAAFHAYGLEKSDVEYIVNDFHRVQSPRTMTEEYFQMVLENFDQLAEKGPHK